MSLLVKLLAALVMISSLLNAALPKEAISSFNRLITQRQYFSAYEILEKADPTNQDPDIFLKKVDMADHFYLKHINHQAVSFADLKSDETLEFLRKEDRMTPTFPLKQDSSLRRLIEMYPERKELYLVRSNYLTLAYFYYGNLWAGYTDVLSQAATDAKTAQAAGLSSALSFLSLTLEALTKEDLPQAKKMLQKAKEKDSKNEFVLLIEAEILRRDGKVKEALEIALSLKERLTPVPRQKAVLLQLIGKLYEAKAQPVDAMTAYEESASLDATPLETQLGLLRGKLAAKKMDEATQQALRLLKRRSTESDINLGIQSAYLKYNVAYAIPPLYREAITAMGSNPKAAGFLKFSLGQYLLKNTDNHEEGISALKQARQSFLIVYPPDHPMIQTIEVMLISATPVSEQNAGQNSGKSATQNPNTPSSK